MRAWDVPRKVFHCFCFVGSFFLEIGPTPFLRPCFFLQPFWASMSTQQHENSGSHQSISVLQCIVLISGECGGNREPSLCIQFSSHTGVQAVPPKACEHITGIRRNLGHRFQFGRKGDKASLPPAEPPLCGPLPNHVRRRTSWGRGHQYYETQAASQILSLGPTSLKTIFSYSLYTTKSGGKFPSECCQMALAYWVAVGSTLVKISSPFYMCTTLSYDSYNKFIIPVFVRSFLHLPVCMSPCPSGNVGLDPLSDIAT